MITALPGEALHGQRETNERQDETVDRDTFLDTGKHMPIVLRVRGYRFWFYEADLDEPPHVHVGKGGKKAKYWLTPIALARSRRFRDHELHEIERIVVKYQDDILRAWRKEQHKRGNR